MADLEVIKHTKKIVATTKNKEYTLWKKVKEIILEIFIIVFAVSISIWFHNLNLKSENRQKEKDFLEGISKDLQNDVEEWKKQKQAYTEIISALDYQVCIGEGKGLCDSSKNNQFSASLNSLSYTPVHNSWFEAFKSSGNLDLITDKTLMKTIVNYYHEAIPFIQAQKERFNTENNRVLNVYKENAVFNADNTYNFPVMLKKPPVIFQIKMMRNSIFIVDQLSDIITTTEKLIADIEKEIK